MLKIGHAFRPPSVQESGPKNVVWSPPAEPVAHARRALYAVAPWSLAASAEPAYPGRHAIWRQLLPGVALVTIRSWLAGRRAMPQWARDKLAAELDRRIALYSEISAALKRKSPP